MAAFDQPWPKNFSVVLQPIGKLLSVQQTPFACVLHFEKETLYIQFPSFGGVRVRNGNEGFFTPEALTEITYSANGGIKAGDTSVTVAPADNHTADYKVRLHCGNQEYRFLWIRRHPRRRRCYHWWLQAFEILSVIPDKSLILA